MALDTIGQQLRAQAPANPAETQPEPGHHEQLEDYAQILQGRLQLQHTSLALAELLHRSWQAQAAQAQRKGLRCTCHGLSQLPARVHADPQRLQQIIDNLLSNAIRLTASGRVELHAHWQHSTATAGVLYLYVVDTGAGLSNRAKDRLFDPFDHVLDQLHRHHRGQNGFARHLGLVVTAGIVRAWGGQIEVRSALGTGSTFMVELPMACG